MIPSQAGPLPQGDDPTAAAPGADPPLAAAPLELRTDWLYDASGARRHYVVEAFADGRRCGLGYGWYEAGERLVLEKIEIDAGMRSRGYGSAIIERLRAKARELGCRELVFKGVRTGNHGAIRLYESMGAVGMPAKDDLQAFVLSPP